MRLEQIIASSCRQKILLSLSKIRKTHVTKLIRIVNSTYNQVNRNLRILEKEGIINTKQYGRMRMIELNAENPRTQTLLKALHLLDKPVLDSRTTRKNHNDLG